MQNRLVEVAFVVVAGVAGCSQAQTTPLRAARLTIDGATHSFWEGGVGSAHVDLSNSAYTITGSAYGINSSNPNKVVTTDFKITAEC